ncbi:hypothetical protein TNCV_1959001 [Trichonephila clavipes]|nr:hypothetical protein TNCV_1959001 [Trichonephila clavipes]
MLPIEHVWDLVGWRLAHDLRPTASKDEVLLCLPQEDIQYLTSCHVVKQHLWQHMVATLNTDFGHLILVSCFENFLIYLCYYKSFVH